MSRDRSEETIEVAHEQLIRSWPRLCNWVNENRDFLLWRAQLGAFIETWRKLGSGNNGLLEGRELRSAQQWLRRNTRDLNGEERAFILKGSSRKRISRTAIALIAVAVLSIGVWAGYQQTDHAQVRAAIRDANDRITQISDPRSRSFAQSELAEALAKAGRMQQAETLLEEAQKAAGQISDPRSRFFAQSELAEALAKTGRMQQAGTLLEEAQKTAGQMSDPLLRSGAQRAVAEALAKTGKFEEAQKAAGQISDPLFRSGTQRVVAEALAKAGKFQQARSLADQLGAVEAVTVHAAIITRYSNKHP